VRPAGEGDTIYELTKNRHVIKDSVSVKDEPDQLITRVAVNHGIVDPTKSLDEKSNYIATELIFSDDAEVRERYDGARTKTINSRWMPKSTAGAAIDLAETLIQEYSNIPRKVSFSVDAKDRDVWVGSFAKLTTRQNVDVTGAEQPMNLQIIEATETQAGTKFSYTAKEFSRRQFGQPDVYEVYLLSGKNVNLKQAYDNETSTDPTTYKRVDVYIRNGVQIGSTDTSGTSLTVGSWPSGTNLRLIIESGGLAEGAGGDGGDGGDATDVNTPAAEPGEDGENGGDAIDATGYPIEIDNQGSIYSGGGGAGGGGGHLNQTIGGAVYNGGGGGGGAAGVFGGNGGTGGDSATGDGSGNDEDGAGGAAGSTSDGGLGGDGGDATFDSGDPDRYKAGDGGNAGDPGEDGQNGEDSADSADVSGPGGKSWPGGTGGTAGNYIVGNNNVTWINKGDVQGYVS